MSQPRSGSSRQHAFQAPKGTRDFFPADLAVRRHIEGIWRDVSVRHGFDEIDGPTFEHLDLYTVKSGPGIVSELFSFERSGGDTTYALRPEFTPTLARMVAQHGASLPAPTKWFSICNYFRAERPQRGRLREFLQWNVDIIGDDSPRADAEIIACCIGALEQMGFTPDDVKIKISDRRVVQALLKKCGVIADRIDDALVLLDKREKLPPDKLCDAAKDIDLDVEKFDREIHELTQDGPQRAVLDICAGEHPHSILHIRGDLDACGVADWIEFDFSIVRGLAYYTGTVFEVHETTGKERAIAGGGRYDKLIELFGGKPTPAVGFAMGDVVIRLVMQDHGLISEPESHLPRPDVFVIASPVEVAQERFRPLVAELRRAGLHVRHTYRSTSNVGKLLAEAGKARARFAVVLGEDVARGQCELKNLDTKESAVTEIDSIAREVGCES